jgi:predicted nuclease of predicted toxin-antitoxin system
MAIRFYLDVHVPRAIAFGLRLRGVDILTAQDDGAERLADEAVLQRAAALGRVLLTSDHDFLALADQSARTGRPFPGIVFAHALRVSIGVAVKDVALIAGAADPADLADRVEFLPLAGRP